MPDLAQGGRQNLWSAHSAELLEAYTQSNDSVRFSVVTRALTRELGERSRNLCDIGGGHGRQAVLLARHGHRVTVVDADASMLRVAKGVIASEPANVQRNVSLLHADGADPDLLRGQLFDGVLCHSVLMYEVDPLPLLRTVVRITANGGVISVLSVNPDSLAMRPGLQGRWRDALARLRGIDPGTDSYPTRNHSLQNVADILRGLGVHLTTWHGVGIFTDHISGRIEAAEPTDVFEAEWQAGLRDPYRHVARCFHLMGSR